MAKSKSITTQEPDAGLALARMQLSALTLSDLNPREHVTEAEIDAMADSIAQLGLLQNLIGLQIDGDDLIYIVGGGKRLRAMQKLTREGFMPKHAYDPVMVLITRDPVQAVAMAGAENNARQNLNHADEIQSYLTLSTRGLTTSVIAATYGQTEGHVRRMLKLAELPAVIMANLGKGAISIDQARAFTFGRDAAAMIDLLRAVLERGLNPAQIRHALTPESVSSTDWRVEYVGLDAYLAAGGHQIEDLFSDYFRLTDEPLLQKLFLAKGQAETEALRADGGWKWATFVPERWIDHALMSKLTAIYPSPGVLPGGDQARLDHLAAQAQCTEAEVAEMKAMEARAKRRFSDEDRASSGFFTTAKDGKLQIYNHYRRPADAPARIDPETGVAITPAVETKGHPENLRSDLGRIKLAAMQTALMGHPELLYNLLTFCLCAGIYGGSRPLDITLTRQPVEPERLDGTTLDARLTPPALDTTDASADAFRAWCDLSASHRDQLLTQALARAYRPGTGSLADYIAALVQPDVRSIWTPTAAGFLGRTSADYLDALFAKLTDATPESLPVAVFGLLKKAAKAKELESLFADMSVREAMGLSRAQNEVIDGWLLPELQWGAT